MNLRLSLILFCLIWAGSAYGQCFSYTVNACIDYDDYLNIRGDSLWWVNNGASPPNTHSGCGPAVTVNGANWLPWNSVYILPNSTQNCTMVATVNGCSNICNVLQIPTAANGWWGIYDFNDEGPGGAHPYSITFAFFCPVVTISPNTSICAGASTTLSATGGSTYSWSPAGSLSCSNCANPVASPTTTTTYTVTATDAYNCTGSASVTITVNPIVITPSSTPVSCFGGNNGDASVSATGGNPALTYAWNNGPTTANNPNVAAATYTVTVTDAMSCTNTATVTVSQPALLVANATAINVTCFGANNGAINVTPGGDTYAWNDGNTAQNRTGLAMGNYSVTVTDANMCTASTTATISEPPLLTASAVSTGTSCNGGSDGTVTLTIAGGTPTYTYVWNDGNTNQNRTGVAAGNYSVTVTDNNLCTASTSVTVSQPPAFTANAITTETSCNGGSDGTVTVTLTNGISPFTFSWNDGNSNQSRTGLSANTYSVTATDAHNCTAQTSAVVTQPTLSYVGVTPAGVSCFGGNNGSIATVDTGGTAPYTWHWSDSNTAQNRTSLAAGTYTVTAADSHACTVSASATVTQPAAIVIAPTYISDSCYLAANGSCTLTLAGGATPFTFAWNNGDTNQNRTNLAAGTYTVTVTDNNSCTSSISIAISQPPLLTALATPTAVSCLGGSDGKINTIENGGTTPYTYLWNDGITTQNRTQLATGTYNITVTDNLLCTASASATVIAPDSIHWVTSVSNPVCPSSDHNGSIMLNISGGTQPYVYTWSDNSGGSSLTQLTVGNYWVTVTDAHGCTADNNFTLEYLFDYTVVANQAGTLTLGQGETLTYTLSGNAGNYTSLWSPPSGLSCSACATPVASPVRTTLYNITVQNDSGCTVTDTVTVYVIPEYNIFIPNAFSPGSNGNNNFFSIYGNTQQLEFLEVAVFDRLGEKVFGSTNINFAWDGSFKGSPMPLGVYVYTLKLVFIDGHTEKLRTGSVTLLR